MKSMKEILESVKKCFLRGSFNGLCAVASYLYDTGEFSKNDVYIFYGFLKENVPDNEYTRSFEFFKVIQEYFWALSDYQSRIDWLNRHINRLKKQEEGKSRTRLYFEKLWLHVYKVKLF